MRFTLGAFAMFLAGCVSPYPVPSDLNFKTTILASEDAPDITNIVYLHGMGCHEPGYSTPIQYRLIDKINSYSGTNYERSTLQTNDFENHHFTYYEFERPEYLGETEDWPASKSFLNVTGIYDVHDPTSFDLVERPALNRIIPTSSGRRSAYEKKYEALKSLPAPADDIDRLDNFGDFTDVCLDRSKKSPAEPKNSDLGPGVMVREFYDRQSGKTVRFVEVLWSPISEPVKRHWLGYDFVAQVADDESSARDSQTVLFSEDETTEAEDPFVIVGSRKESSSDKLIVPTKERAFINRAVKDRVLNSGFPDAVFYVGAGRSSVMTVVTSALCFGFFDHPSQALEKLSEEKCALDEEQDNSAVEFYAESLGSRILFDALANFAVRQSENADASLQPDGNPSPETMRFYNEILGSSSGHQKKGPSVFLFANQLPLLEIGIGQINSSYFPADDPLMLMEWMFVENYGLALDPEFYNDFQSYDYEQKCLIAAERFQWVRQYGGQWFQDVLEELDYGEEFDLDDLNRMQRIVRNQIQAHDFLLSARAICDAAIEQKRLEHQTLNEITAEDLARSQNQSEEEFNQEVIQRAKAEATLGLGALGLHAITKPMMEGGPHVLDLMLYQVGLIDIQKELNEIANECTILNQGSARSTWNPSCKERVYSAIDSTNLPQLGIMAFSDANDFLTYEIADSFKNSFSRLDFQNIPLRIEVPLIPVRGSWGIVANPDNAHTNYRFSIQTMNWLVCGSRLCD